MRDDIRKRIEAVRRGEVPEGYVSENHQLRPCDWRYEKIGKYLVAYDEYSNDTEQYELATSSRQGLMLQTDYYSDQRFDETAGGFHVVPEGYITYRHMSDDDIFKFNVNQLGAPVLVSPEYPVFTTTDELRRDLLLEYLNDSAEFRAFCRAQKKGSTRTRMYFSRLGEFSMPIPPKAEQQRITEILSACDRVVELKQKLVEELQQLKKTCLAKMFPQIGCAIPEIRFTEFTDPWEQRKFSELVLIERGGSPRPIDDYITDAPDGLNWVKIGDAPEQGRYITKTAEKIKPEGLSKTRQVQPGDLILSNSMSFGKPYIMGINGCIHDGWLLIRDTQKRFDLKFLCHMLGTGQMLDQYRMFAAGSTVNNLNKELVGSTTVSLPSIEEQRVIGEYLESIDTLITLHQHEMEEVQQKKKALMQLLLTGLVRVNA